MRQRILPVLVLGLLLVFSPLPTSAQDGLPSDAASLPISQLLSLASSALSSGKTHSALEIYDHCLSRDPSDVPTLFKRATARLAAGQWARAKEGFGEVLEVREWAEARWQLCKLHAKLGELDEAKRETHLLLENATDPKLTAQAQALLSDIATAKAAAAKAENALASGDVETCLSAVTTAVALSTNSAPLRLVRAECQMLANEFDSAIGDLSRASALLPSLAPHLLVRLSLLGGFFVADGSIALGGEALGPLKRCLQGDPDSKTCSQPLRRLKKLDKALHQAKNWLEAQRWGELAVAIAGGSTKQGLLADVKEILLDYQVPLKSSPDAPAPLPKGVEQSSPLLTTLHSSLCQAYVSTANRKANVACPVVLERDPNNKFGLINKGDQLLVDEKWQEAVNVFSEAFEASGRSDRQLMERLQKAQRLLKQSTAKDYYKVLGVSRDADAKTIKKAYRKGTLKAHPDKPGGSEDKMAALNEAYEILSNPELRARFDNGDDPNEQQQGPPGGGFHGGHPFFAGGQHFFQGAGGGFPGGGFPGGGFPGGGGGGQKFEFRWG